MWVDKVTWCRGEAQALYLLACLLCYEWLVQSCSVWLYMKQWK